MARVVRIHEFGGPEVLQIDTVKIGRPGPGEVRIAVAAFGLNRVEALYRAGYFGSPALPAKIGYEAAGFVEETGRGVTHVKAGDRVAVLFGLPMEKYGTYADTILYPANRVIPLDHRISLIHAAASWMQFGTAYALIAIGMIEAGEHVVITAASSSVGLAAIQIARSRGAIPIAITRHESKAERLTKLGAAHVIASDNEPDLAQRVRSLTNEKGARVIFDAVGGTTGESLVPGAIANEGIAIIYGMLGGTGFNINLPALMQRNATLRGWSADLLTANKQGRDALATYVGDELAAGRLYPIIDRTFPLDDIVAAHRHLESNTQIGKIVVTTGHE